MSAQGINNLARQRMSMKILTRATMNTIKFQLVRQYDKIIAYLKLTNHRKLMRNPTLERDMAQTNIDAKALKHMIKQMLIIGFEGCELEQNNPYQKIVKEEIGGVIAFDYDYQRKQVGKNILSPEQTAKLNQQCQTLNPYGYRSIDSEGGDYLDDKTGQRRGVNRLKAAYGFPQTLCPQDIGSLVATGKIDQARVAIEKHADTVSQAGFNLVFAPIVDVDINPNCPIVGALARSYSANPDVVIECARLFIEVFSAKNIQTVLKHFPGHGSANTDTHLHLTDITDTWQKTELLPYKELANQCGMVMVGHLLHRDIDQELPASLSSKFIQELLRGKLGFNGVVVSDDLQMHGVKAAINNKYQPELSSIASENEKNSFIDSKIIEHAINAGTDILIFGNQLAPNTPSLAKTIENHIVNLLEENKISLNRILESYQRIQAAKSLSSYFR